MNLNEQIAVMQAFIFHRKGVNVDINMQQFRQAKNLMLLQSAYAIAITWFGQNSGSINLV